MREKYKKVAAIDGLFHPSNLFPKKEANTGEAMQLGAFGAPSFSIGNEKFLGVMNGLKMPSDFQLIASTP